MSLTPSEQRLLDSLDRGEAPVNQLVQLVESKNLKEELLRAVNSAEHSFSRRVEQVRHAIALLGQKRVHQFLSEHFIRIDSGSTGPVPKPKFTETETADQSKASDARLS